MTVQILTGDARTVLRDLPSGSVQCVVTSPPYLNLRDYHVVGQIGNEATVDLYVNALVETFGSPPGSARRRMHVSQHRGQLRRQPSGQ